MNERDTGHVRRGSWRARRNELRRALACAALCAWQSHAGAQDRGAARAAAGPRSRVVTISEVTIVGRIQKPIAAVDVSRIQPKLTLAELRQPFLQGIEKAIYSSPF
jgi:hypothetical protein